MGGRKGSGGRGAGRGGRGRAPPGRGRGGRGPSDARLGGGGGIYGPERSAHYVAVRGFPGGGPKRKHRQMAQAYGASRRAEARDSDDSGSSDDDADAVSGLLAPSASDGASDEDDDDPNTRRADFMRVGGVRIRLDRGAADDADGASASSDAASSSASDASSLGSELSLDSDAIADYVRNCGEDSDSEEARAAEEEDPADAEARYLRGMRDITLRDVNPEANDDVPSPPDSMGLDTASEDELEALTGGAYGEYLDRGGSVSSRRAAKKALKKALKRGESLEEVREREREALPRPAAVAEALRMMILSGAAYVGFRPTRSTAAIRALAAIAAAFGLRVSSSGGGKRRHPVVHWTPRARVPAADDEGLLRAIASAGGDGWRPGGNWEGFGARAPDVDRRFEKNFVSAGIMNEDDGSGDGDDDEAPREDGGAGPSGKEGGVGEGVGPAGGMGPAGGAGAGAGPEEKAFEGKDAASDVVLGASERKKKGKTVAAGHGFGAFEKHTSGFGSKMLAKMGFQGEGSGVGKGGAGIAVPIEAEMRAKRVGLGAERRR